MTNLTSSRNPTLRASLKLRRGSERRKRGTFGVEGAREIGFALEASYQPVRYFCCSYRLTEGGRQVKDRLDASSHCERYEVPEETLARLVVRDPGDGIWVEFKRRDRRLDLNGEDPHLILVAHQIEKPGNLGALVRVADGVGASALIASDSQSDIYNPHVIRTSLGAVFSLPVVTMTMEETQSNLRANGFSTYVASPDAACSYHQVAFAPRTALVVGSEDQGVGPGWEAGGATPLSLPMLGRTDSLNVATAGAILAYEIRRQWTVLPSGN